MITKTESNMTRFTNLSGLYPTVNLLIDQGDRRQTDACLPRVERSRRKKERERAQKRKPQRINLDLPLDLKKRLETLAKLEEVPVSQLAVNVQAGEWQQRVDPGEEHQVHLGRHVLEKMGNHLQNWLGLDSVKIMQDENERDSLPVDLVDDTPTGSDCASEWHACGSLNS
jgi:hypothetical protein